MALPFPVSACARSSVFILEDALHVFLMLLYCIPYLHVLLFVVHNIRSTALTTHIFNNGDKDGIRNYLNVPYRFTVLVTCIFVLELLPFSCARHTLLCIFFLTEILS